MKTSTEIGSIAKLVGEERAIEYVAEAGFEAWDFSMFAMCKYDWKANKLLENDHPLAGGDYLSFARRLRRVGLDNGIVCNQAHAPFPTRSPEIRAHYKRAIECAAEAGAAICVIHPDNDKSAEQNAEMYLELLPFAKEHGIKIATENMWNWNYELDEAAPAACSHHDDFVRHIDAVGDEFFTACLDIGHAEMRGLRTSSAEMIRALGKKRLGALHIHDNDLHNDSHMVPFTMNIDFDGIAAALKEIGYEGDLTLESDAYLGKLCQGDKEKVFEGVKIMASALKRLAGMFKA